jgi:hypothetical protein
MKRGNSIMRNNILKNASSSKLEYVRAVAIALCLVLFIAPCHANVTDALGATHSAATNVSTQEKLNKFTIYAMQIKSMMAFIDKYRDEVLLKAYSGDAMGALYAVKEYDREIKTLENAFREIRKPVFEDNKLYAAVDNIQEQFAKYIGSNNFDFSYSAKGFADATKASEIKSHMDNMSRSLIIFKGISSAIDGSIRDGYSVFGIEDKSINIKTARLIDRKVGDYSVLGVHYQHEAPFITAVIKVAPKISNDDLIALARSLNTNFSKINFEILTDNPRDYNKWVRQVIYLDGNNKEIDAWSNKHLIASIWFNSATNSWLLDLHRLHKKNSKSIFEAGYKEGKNDNSMIEL